MTRIRLLRRIPVVELVLVLLGTGIMTFAGLATGISHRLADLIDSTDPYHGIADIGPALLFLSIGMGIVTMRRWRESEMERQKTEQTTLQLEHSEHRYRSLVEVSPDPIVVIVDGVVKYANPAAATFLGAAEAAELIGMAVVDRLPAEVREEAAEWMRQVMASGTPTPPIEYPILRLDGSAVDAETAVARMPFESGWALQAVIRDISSRKVAEEALTRYRALEENTRDIVFFSSPDGRIIDCNRAALLLYGYTKEELLGMTTAELKAPGCDAPTGVEATTSAGDIARFDTVHARKDGTTVELSVTSQRIALGNDEFVVSLCRDVTDKRKSERALKASEQRYRGLIELSPSPIAVIDRDRRIIFANASLADLLRAGSAQELKGSALGRFIEDGSIARFLDRPGDEPARSVIDVPLHRSDGTTVQTEVAYGPTSFGGVDGIQLVLQDVTRLKDETAMLRRTTEDTISAMARLAETRDPYTSGHQERVAQIAVRMARRMGLDPTTCESIRLSGVVHDIGKMNVPAEILAKPGKLSDAEFQLIKDHVERGYEVLRPIDFPWPIADIVRQHHERLDGSGYPRGLRGDAIRLEARILAVADTVEAISSHRPYRPALGLDFALQVIHEGRGTLYDPACVDAAADLASEGSLLDDHQAHGSAGGVRQAAI